MPTYIIHKDGVYNLYTTIADGCYFEHGLTLAELEAELGTMELSPRLERAHATGCSGVGWSLDQCIRGNRAGPNEAEVSRDEFIAKFLALPTRDGDGGRGNE